MLHRVERFGNGIVARFSVTARLSEGDIFLRELDTRCAKLVEVETKCLRLRVGPFESPLSLPKLPAQIVKRHGVRPGWGTDPGHARSRIATRGLRIVYRALSIMLPTDERDL